MSKIEEREIDMYKQRSGDGAELKDNDDKVRKTGFTEGYDR